MMKSAKITVAIRVRPLLREELAMQMKSTRLFCNLETKEIRVDLNDKKSARIYRFDHLLNENSSQEDVYRETKIENLLNRVAEGYHCTIFAYGQTGSGKTYTMEGFNYTFQGKHEIPRPIIDVPNSNLGVTPRIINNFFDILNSHAKLYSTIFKVFCTFYQIYNERIYDLLNPDTVNDVNRVGPGLRLRWHPKEEFIVENLQQHECSSADQVFHYYCLGLQNKVMASHRLNSISSRSHCILTLTVESYDLVDVISVVRSKLVLVDLAGSERPAVTGTIGKQHKEAIEINKSLFTLRQVINSLGDAIIGKAKKECYIPYRDSKLTSLLRHSLGGNSYCLMIACLSPSDDFFEENISTLNYAKKTSYISNIPVRNEEPRTKMLNDLRIMDNNLAKTLDEAQRHVLGLTAKVSDRINRGELYSINHEDELRDYINLLTEINADSRKLRKKEGTLAENQLRQERELTRLHLENESLRDHHNVLTKLYAFDAANDEFAFNLEWAKQLKPNHKEYFRLLQHREELIELVRLSRENRLRCKELEEIQKENKALSAIIDQKYPKLDSGDSPPGLNQRIHTIHEVANSHEFESRQDIVRDPSMPYPLGRAATMLDTSERKDDDSVAERLATLPAPNYYDSFNKRNSSAIERSFDTSILDRRAYAGTQTRRRRTLDRLAPLRKLQPKKPSTTTLDAVHYQ